MPRSHRVPFFVEKMGPKKAENAKNLLCSMIVSPEQLKDNADLKTDILQLCEVGLEGVSWHKASSLSKENSFQPILRKITEIDDRDSFEIAFPPAFCCKDCVESLKIMVRRHGYEWLKTR